MNVSNRPFSYVLSVTLCLLLWKGAALLLSSPVLPPPEETLGLFFQHLGMRTFWTHFGISAYRVVISILLAWSIAFPVGILIGYSRRLDKIFSPMIFMTYPIPKMVLLPVILLLFGLGDLSKIILISLILFFQILVATRDGVQGIDEKYFDSMLSMGARDRDILREVVIPAALPHSFTALRISTGTAISVLFFVESFATTSGLGYLIMDSWVRTAYTRIYVGIIGMSLLGLMLYELFRQIEERACAWKFAGKEREENDSIIVPLLSKALIYSRMIKISHTIFALPFALASVVLVHRVAPLTASTMFWVVMAVVGARSAAMGFNRLADAAIDRRNPRTAKRDIPIGAISKSEATAFIGVSALIFIVAAAMLSVLCFWLSFPVLGILFLYSYTKRFTWLSHVILGFAISMVPLGVWVAVTGTLSFEITIMSLALLTYIAGFDILYACQDIEFDRAEHLHSIPAIFGVDKALAVSSLMHVISFAALLSLYWIFSLAPIYLLFAGIIGLLFIVEHRLVKPDDLSRINVAFYHVNSIISVLVFVAVLFGDLLRNV